MARYSYDHIHLRSPKPKETAEWFGRTFDAKLVPNPRPNMPDRVDVDLDGLLIYIAGELPAGAELYEPPNPHYGLDHFGLRVESLDETLAILTSRGVEIVEGPRQAPGGPYIAFVRGPDNMRIEILQR